MLVFQHSAHLKFRSLVYSNWMILTFILDCRIVLERPEYGYATYFFELVESLPIDWQIKRLVTAMKLTTCSRISLIENKPLSVIISLNLTNWIYTINATFEFNQLGLYKLNATLFGI